jgi:peptide/nickel transport system permease protein
LLVVFLLTFMGLAAPLLTPYSPTSTVFGRALPPGRAHWLGTTLEGQDIFARLVFGTRTSLVVGFVAGILTAVLALTMGLLTGYLKGPVEWALTFGTNVFLVIPTLPLIIVVAAYVKGGNIWGFVLIIVGVGWAFGARVIRGQVASLRARDFVTAAVLSGESTFRIIFREILPNMLSIVAAAFFLASTSAVLAEAGLEFLGLGNPDLVSWGNMLYWANNDGVLLQGNWAAVLAPGLSIALLAGGLSLINVGVDVLSNPRLREG